MSEKGSNIFDKLTDPKLYTGTHKNRFDENGKGKGIDGRVDRVDASGYVNGFKPDAAKTKSSKKNPEIFDRLTDPKLYTGAHKYRFDADGKGLGVNQTVDRDQVKDLSDITRPEIRKAASQTASSPQKKSTTPTKTGTGTTESPKKKSDIFDRLTDPKLYTGTHKHRFDADGKGRGKQGRTDEVVADGYVQGFKRDQK